MAVLEANPTAEARRVLVLGCGEGELLERLSADPTFVEIVGVDGSARVLDLSAADPSKAERQAVAAHNGPVNGVAALPDGATLLTASEDKSIKTWPLSAAGSGCGPRRNPS